VAQAQYKWRKKIKELTQDYVESVCMCVSGLNALQLLNAAAGSAPNPSSMPNSYGLSSWLAS